MTDSGALPGPAITVHWLAHAEAALCAAAEARRPVTLLSAPGAAFTVGPLYFREMVALARRAVPGAESLALFDCEAAAGRALEALHCGLEAVVFSGAPAQRAALEAIAGAAGALLVVRRPPALDLLDRDRPDEAAAHWLRHGTSGASRR
jgi:hypothetical protein